MNAADIGSHVGGNKGSDDGNGGIRGKSLVVNQLRADAELVRLVEIILRPNHTGDISLWTGDVPLESEHHVIPLNR
jgi:hypothetical protein